MSVKFHIKTKNLDLTPEINSLIHEKLSVVDKYLDTSGDAEILAEVEVGLETTGQQSGDIYRTEINLTYKGDLYRAVTNAGTINEAMDELKEEITKQLRRDKDKSEDLMKKGGREAKEMLQSE